MESLLKLFYLVLFALKGILMLTSIEVIPSDGTMNWIDAHKWCRDHDARLPTKDEFLQSRTDFNISWLETYIARTDYMTNLGCFDLYNNENFERIEFPGEQLNGPRCFFKCREFLKKNITYFALKVNTCFCLNNDKLMKKDVKLSSGCLQPCEGSTRACGGVDTYTLYRVEIEHSYEVSKGWCGTTTSPFRKLEFKSCSKEKYASFCKIWNETTEKIDWYEQEVYEWDVSEMNCNKETSLGSIFSIASLGDFADYNENTDMYYWVTTRIEQQLFSVTDTFFELLEEKYLYRCSIYNIQQKEKKDIGCDKEETFICLKEVSRVRDESTIMMNTSNTTFGLSQDENSGEVQSNTNALPMLMYIIIALTGILLVAVILIVILIYRKRKNKKNYPEQYEQGIGDPAISTSYNALRNQCSDNLQNDYDEMDKVEDTQNTVNEYGSMPADNKNESENNYDIALNIQNNDSNDMYDHTNRIRMHNGPTTEIGTDDTYDHGNFNQTENDYDVTERYIGAKTENEGQYDVNFF